MSKFKFALFGGFVGSIVLGSFILSEVVGTRMKAKEAREGKQQSLSDFEKKCQKEALELAKASEFSLEKEYEQLQQKVDLERWSSKRVPRPVDENEFVSSNIRTIDFFI